MIKRRQPYKSFGGGITKFIRSKAACLQAPVMYNVKVKLFKVSYWNVFPFFQTFKSKIID